MKPVVKNIQECTVCQVNNTIPPTVEAHNSSHLNVSWENVFQGCEDFEVKNMVLDIDGEKRTREFDQKTTLIQASACTNHTIIAELILEKAEKGSLKSAEISYAAKERTYCEKAVTASSQASNGLAIGLSVGIGSLLVILAVAGILVFRNRKKQSRKEDEKFVDNDENPVYGLYSSDGIYTATEMTDNNEMYGVGDI